MLSRGAPLAAMSAKKRARLAEAGTVNPYSTLLPAAPPARKPILRTVVPVKRPTYTGPSKAVRDTVDIRSGGRCEWPGCAMPQTDRHHRLNRKQGGRKGAARERVNGVAWLLGCCRAHHERVTNPVGRVRVEAERMGWILREHQNAETPVLTRHHPLPVLLNGNGSWTAVREVAA